MADEDVLNCKQEYLIIFNGTSHGIFLISFTNVHTPFHFEQQRKRVWSIIYTAMQYKWTIFKKDFKNPIFQVQFRLCTCMFAMYQQIKALNCRLLISIPCCSNTSLNEVPLLHLKLSKSPALYFSIQILAISIFIPKAILYLVFLLVAMKRKNKDRAHVHLLSSKYW